MSEITGSRIAVDTTPNETAFSRCVPITQNPIGKPFVAKLGDSKTTQYFDGEATTDGLVVSQRVSIGPDAYYLLHVSVIDGQDEEGFPLYRWAPVALGQPRDTLTGRAWDPMRSRGQ